MGKHIEVTPQTVKQLQLLYVKQENSLKELSVLHRLSITKIRNLLLENGIKLRKTGTHNYITTNGQKVKDLHSEIIKEYKTGKSLRRVAATHGVSYQTISNVLAEHKVLRRGKGSYGKLTDKQKKRICKLYDTTNIKELANENSVSVATILKILKSSGIAVTHGRKYKLNQEVFDELNPQNAYWLGFLFARGNIKSQNHFDIYFHDSMKDTVEKFRKFLMSNQPFLTVCLKNSTNNKKYTLNRLAVSSTKLVNKLTALGVDKVSQIEYPKYVSKQNLDREFITGYFDGCGLLKNNQPVPYLQLRSNVKFLNTINKVITKNTPGKLQCDIINSSFNPIYGLLRYTGKESVYKVKKFITLGSK